MRTEEVRAASRLGSPGRREIPLRGYVIVLGGTIIWALAGIVIKILLTQYGMTTLTIAFWRVALVAVFMLLALLVVDAKSMRVSARDVPLLFVYGLVGIGAHQIVWITSVQYNGAAVATVILYTGPAIVAGIAARFLHEGMSRTKLAALVLTTIGCALVARGYDLHQVELNVIGIAAGIGSACTFASYSLIGRVIVSHYSPWTSVFYAFLFGAVSLLPLSLLTGSLVAGNLAPGGLATLVFLALVPTLGGFGSYTIGLSHLPASTASILAAFEPVTTAIVAYFLFGETFEPLQLVGGGLILASVIMLRPRQEAKTQLGSVG